MVRPTGQRLRSERNASTGLPVPTLRYRPGAMEARGVGTTSSVRWGIPDALLCYVAGLVAAIVTTTIVAGATGVTEDSVDDSASVLAAAFIGQYGGTLLAVWAVSRRKGRGSLIDDFGLRIWLSDWWLLPAGALLEVVCAALLIPLSELAGDRTQEVVRELQEANGAKLAVLVVGAGLLAPVVEELLFRGLLLRALLRRMDATWAVSVSALAFGVLHLIDPSIGTVVALPALVAVGVVSGVLAVRTGDLSRSILLHAGFNLVTVLAELSSR
jgi:membrane protease YdiL (CAAX protease family)